MHGVRHKMQAIVEIGYVQMVQKRVLQTISLELFPV